MKTSIKTLALAVAVFAAASCTWDPIKHDIPAVPETMVVTASADEIVLLEIVKENGEESYRTIDNEILLDEVFAEFQDLFDEEDGEEE